MPATGADFVYMKGTDRNCCTLIRILYLLMEYTQIAQRLQNLKFLLNIEECFKSMKYPVFTATVCFKFIPLLLPPLFRSPH